uniref:Uncharacterized protein n=1 Tax=Vespula pensylvanica TaxID=30213 RepID=A0A834NWF8_VESPE|nr:hypothetical protein H0235_010097 [Vespula pensylvanica]
MPPPISESHPRISSIVSSRLSYDCPMSAEICQYLSGSINCQNIKRNGSLLLVKIVDAVKDTLEYKLGHDIDNFRKTTLLVWSHLYHERFDSFFKFSNCSMIKSKQSDCGYMSFIIVEKYPNQELVEVLENQASSRPNKISEYIHTTFLNNLFKELLFESCTDCRKMAAVPQAAFAASKVRCNEKHDNSLISLIEGKEKASKENTYNGRFYLEVTLLLTIYHVVLPNINHQYEFFKHKINTNTKEHFSTSWELTPLKYNSKLMNSIWGLYNRYSVHNFKKNTDANEGFLATVWQTVYSNPSVMSASVVSASTTMETPRILGTRNGI